MSEICGPDLSLLLYVGQRDICCHGRNVDNPYVMKFTNQVGFLEHVIGLFEQL